MDMTPTPSSGNSNLNEANNCGVDLSQDAIYLPVIYSIFFIIGTPLNLMALFGLYRLIKSENVLPVYVINLLLSDLLQLFTVPLWIDYYRRGHSWRFGSTSCQLLGASFYVSIYTGIAFMCIIALERYLAIAKPLRFQALRKLKFARWIALSIWVVVAVPPSIVLRKMQPNDNHTLCIESYPSKEGFIIYRLITLSLSFIIPLAFIVILHRKTLRSLSAIGTLGTEEKHRIRGLLILLMVIFILVLGPYHITGCVKYIGLLLHGDACEWEKAVFVPYQLGRGLLSLNSVLDPILYTFLRSDFRAAAGHYLPCLKRMQESVCRTVSHQRTTTKTPSTHSDHSDSIQTQTRHL
uniref:G-protein coupled receptor 4-like n=1 Tax=Oncorhynchus gorbuscha TaxID=8017 RepID=UPI001EAF0E41|nr:G-protein coupled receptor 4-like [Oncorhynchus gorbuscha]